MQAEPLLQVPQLDMASLQALQAPSLGKYPINIQSKLVHQV